MNTTNYIFGYGGLILAESRQMTLGAGVAAIPALLTGFERYWGFSSAKHGLTTVSLRAKAQKRCAGILFPITQPQLRKLDIRERGYDRITLPRKQIAPFVATNTLADIPIYTYISPQQGSPSAACPIVQSDVDAILTGCLADYGEAFARAVVETTSGWNGPWLNDRDQPRYPFAPHNGRFLPTIDAILTDMLGKT